MRLEPCAMKHYPLILIVDSLIKSAGPSLEEHLAVDSENRLLFSNPLSKSVAFQQSSVLKLLFAGLQSLLLMLEWLKIPGDLPPPPDECWIQITPRNLSIFKPVSGAARIRKNCSHALRKTIQKPIKKVTCEQARTEYEISIISS